MSTCGRPTQKGEVYYYYRVADDVKKMPGRNQNTVFSALDKKPSYWD